MRYVLRGSVVALSVLAGSAILGTGGAQNLSITNFQVVSQQVITPTQSRVTYRADLVNGSSSFASVTATASTSNPFMIRVVPGQDTLTFAPVPANSQVTSLNTFSVLVNPNVPFNSSVLQFTFQAVSGPLNANAGPNQTAKVGSTVTLNGSGSTSPGGPLMYSWVFVSKPPTSGSVLMNPASVMPTFIVDVAGTYVIQLTISSGGQSSSATVMVSTGNIAPVANAGPNQTVVVGATVTLDGSGSFDANSNPLTYSWFISSEPSGSQATLTGANTVDPTFVADVAGNYKIQLLVNDGVSNSNIAVVTISTVISPPVANAGPNQVVDIGTLVQLNGSGSTDQDGNPLTYLWNLNSAPTGSKAVLSSDTIVNPTFTADLGGIYVAQLTVSDNGLNSAKSTVTIAAQSPLAPSAFAGPNQMVNIGSTVMLSGSGTDPQNLPLTYMWSLSRPTGSKAVLSSTSIPNPTFLADVPGTFVAQLIVSDVNQSSQPSTVTISNTDPPPVANPGTSQTVPVLATVVLNGSGSSDSDNKPLTYTWSFMKIPTGSAAKLAMANTATPTFVADVAGMYVVQLIVNDGFLNSAPMTTTITAAMTVITLSPSPLTLVTGPANLTVMLSAAAYPAAGQVINLSSSNPSAATVPATITVPQGATSATVTVSPGGALGSTTISASAPGLTTGTAMVISNVSQIILPTGVTVGPNATAYFQVTLATPSVNGTFVSLSSSNPSVVTVNPTNILIPAGSTTPSRPPQLTGVAFGTATITASANGLTSSSQMVSVTGSLTLSPSPLTIAANTKHQLTLTLSSPAPASGLTINISVDNPAIATVPATVVIPANATSIGVSVTGVASGTTVVHASLLPILADTTATVIVQ